MALNGGDAGGAQSVETLESGPVASTSTLKPTSSLKELAELANAIAAQPERLALGTTVADWHQSSSSALKAVFQAGE